MTEFVEDMTTEEKKALVDYRANGLPGLGKYDESDIAQWFNLYMGGKTYAEISQIVSTKKDIVLYVADHGKWHNKKMTQYSELSVHIADKIRQTKLKSADTVANLIAGTGHYINEEVTKFQKTNDVEILKGIDSKVLTSYFKSLETLDKIIGSNSKGGVPNINVNLTSGGDNSNKGSETTTVEEKEEGVEITTKNENGDVLTLLARYKKDKNK